MAECSFVFPFDGDPAAFYRQTKDGVAAQGGTLLGDNAQGIITTPSGVGDVSLAYRRTSTSILIDVTDKPMVVPCSKIKDALAPLIPATKKKKVVDTAAVPLTTDAGLGDETRYVPFDNYVPPSKPVAATAKPKISQWKWLVGGAAVLGAGIWWLKR